MTKKVTRSTKLEYYIGLDVHKSTISIAYAAADGSDPVLYGKTTGSNLAVERALTKLRKKLGAEKGDLRICHEAGPTGFVLARRLLQLDYDCIVIAPSKIPQKSGDKVKIAPEGALPERFASGGEQ